MSSITPQGHACSIERLHGAHRVALDARDLHAPTHRVASQPQVVFHADFGRVFNLLGGAPHHGCQTRCGHGAGHADLALTAYFSPADRGVFLVEQPNSSRRQQEIPNTHLGRARTKSIVVMHDSRHDASSAIRWRSDNTATRSVFLVDRHGVDIDEIQDGQLIFKRLLRATAQCTM